MISLSNSFVKKFQKLLLAWSEEHPRPMPWKESKDPYLIWLSEIILQQTRVQQGWDYFLRFKQAFPTVFDLAKAEEGEVLKLWQGLGYYSRARNLHATAKIIAAEYGGVFPSKPKELQSLKGVGPYTAAAIASFAFDFPAAVVDGNVYRILARIFGLATPIDSSAGKKLFQQWADKLLDQKHPAKYNQAIIDFGATHCIPKNPKCDSCPFESHCHAFQNETIADFPYKAKSIKRKDRFFNYLVLEKDNRLLLRHRTGKDIWKGLYDFPAWESDRLQEPHELHQYFRDEGLLRKKTSGEIKPAKRQLLTHQAIFAQFYHCQDQPKVGRLPEDCLWVSREDLNRYAFPKIIHLFLADKDLSLFLQ